MCRQRAFHKFMTKDRHFRHGIRHQHPGRKFWKEKFEARFNAPPVNVQEMDDKYELHIYAAGLEKEDFQISVVDHILTIEVERKNESEENTWKREEYRPGGFKRRFELNEKVDESAIEAGYDNGVLIITLPKLEGFETTRQDIDVV